MGTIYKEVEGSLYRIIANDTGDWYIVGKKNVKTVDILFQGHSKEQAYEAIFQDMGLNIITVHRTMDPYEPYEVTAKDWKKDT